MRRSFRAYYVEDMVLVGLFSGVIFETNFCIFYC